MKRRTRARGPFRQLRHLEPATEALRQSDRDLEQAFSVLSDSFVPLHARLEVLLKNCDELVALASGKRDGMTLFQESVMVLHPPIEYVDFCVSHHARMLELFVRTEQRTQAMLEFQHQMETMLAPLTYIEVLIKIESASLDQEQRDTFLTVVAEIERLHKLVSETFEQNSTLLRETHQTLARIRAKLETDFERHAHYTSERRSQIETAINSLDDQLSGNAGRDVKLQTISRSLAGHISEIVMAIQTQDIVTQKTGHVLTALNELQVDTVGAGHILEVQASQLERISSDVETARRQITSNINLIEKQATAIDHNAVSLDEFTQMTASADGMVQQLLDAYSSVREIIGSTLELAKEAHAAALPASNIASNLSTTLGELSINMRLIALNAQVRSLQISQGTGLEILAARTAAISGEISEISDRVAQDLAGLHDETSEVLNLLTEFKTRGATQLGHLHQHAPKAEQQLHRLRDGTIGVMTSVGEAATSIHQSAKQAMSCLGGIPVSLGKIAEAKRRLQMQITDLGHQTGAEICANTRARLQTHASRYTMASERMVQQTQEQKALTGAAAAEPQDPVNSALTGSSSDIDLFVDVPPPVAASTPEPAVAVSKPASTPAKPPAPVPEAIGANVDLF